ncbi:MAG: hypothetical protein PHT58_04610 [Eubacteriales bacterium]|nr:hypothetical protein [Eubacteriales bacterium]
MKRNLIAFLLVVSILLTMGCTPKNNGVSVVSPETTMNIVPATLAPTDEPTAQPTQQPTPTPAPQVLVMSDNDDFAMEIATSCGAIPTHAADDLTGGRLIVVLQGGYADLAGELVNANAEVIVCSTENVVAAGAIAVPYQGADRTNELVEGLLSYPPHDTPVRLLGLFSSETSALKALWNTNVDAGKIFVKGVFYDGGDNTVDKWMSDMLDKYADGMLDGILCETQAQAKAATAALESAQRLDRIEVFSLEAQNITSPFLIGYVSADWEQAAASAAQAVNALLLNQQPGELTPFSDVVHIVD